MAAHPGLGFWDATRTHDGPDWDANSAATGGLVLTGPKRKIKGAHMPLESDKPTIINVADTRGFACDTEAMIVRGCGRQQYGRVCFVNRTTGQIGLQGVRVETRWQWGKRRASEAVYAARRRLSDWVAP